MNNIIIKSF